MTFEIHKAPKCLMISFWNYSYMISQVMYHANICDCSTSIVFPLAMGRLLFCGGGIFVKLYARTCQDTLHSRKIIIF